VWHKEPDFPHLIVSEMEPSPAEGIEAEEDYLRARNEFEKSFG
jgi:hypothetical protein